MNFDIANMVLNIGHTKNNIDWINPFSVFLSGLISCVVSIHIANINNKKQQEQWLNSTLLSNEYKVLISMKSILSESFNAIRWYFTFVLCDFVIDNDFTDEDILSPDDFVKQINIYQPKLLKLYNFYRENYYIFEKYNIEKEFRIIQFALHISKILNEQEYLYVYKEVVTEQVDDTKIKDSGIDNFEIKNFRYKFMDDVKYLIKDWLEENRPDLLNSKENCGYSCKDYCSKCTNEELALSKMSQELFFLIYKLDKLTVYSKDKTFDFEKEKQKIINFEPYTILKKHKINKTKQKKIIETVEKLKNEITNEDKEGKNDL